MKELIKQKVKAYHIGGKHYTVIASCEENALKVDELYSVLADYILEKLHT